MRARRGLDDEPHVALEIVDVVGMRVVDGDRREYEPDHDEA
jgi:hypothetical protein